MLTVFNSKSIWIGADLKRLNDIRSLLSANDIKYKYTVKSCDDRWLVHGTVRANFGSADVDMDTAYIYEVFVSKKDYYKAKTALAQLRA